MNIIRTDKEGIARQAQRRQAARKRIEYLETLLPSTPSPLTDEDLAIFGMFLQQDAPKFDAFVRASHMDYVPVFYAEVARAIEVEIHKYANGGAA